MDFRRTAFAVLLLTGCATPGEHAQTRALTELAWTPPPAETAPTPTEPLADLQALLREAERRSPALRAAWHDADAVVQGLPAVRKLPEPMVTYSYAPLPVETRLGPQQHRLGVSQSFPWPSKLSRATDAAAAQAAALIRRFEAVRSRVRRDILVPWADLALLAATRAELRAEDELLARIESSVQARVEVARAGYADLARLALRRAELREQAQSQSDEMVGGFAGVRAAAGLRPDAALPTPAFTATPDALPAPEMLAERLLDNPELAVAWALIEQANAAVQLAQTRRLPEFNVGAEWVVVGPRSAAGAESGQDALMLMAGIRVPLWSRAYRAEERAARARVQAAAARRDEVLRGAQARLAALVATWEQARRRVALYDSELLPGAREALASTLQAYATDRATFTDLMELERQILSYRLGRVRAKASQARVLADLELLIGTEVR